MAEHTLVGGQRLSNVHNPSKCVGEYCTIHNFSDHHMVDWPQNWRFDRGIMERVCSHGVGHPDPDDPKTKDPYESVHGCDGCCIRNEGHAVMYNLETLHHPYAGDAMDYIEDLYTLDDKWKVDEETGELYLPDGSKDLTLAQRLRLIYCSTDELEPCRCCLACRAADQIECLEELTDDLAGHLKTYMCHCGLSKCKCDYDYVMDSYRAVRGRL